MAQNITLMGASYSNVPAVTLPKTGGGTARFDDASVTTATASDVASGKVFLASNGTITTGTASGGVDAPTFTVIMDDNPEPVSVTCDKTYAECRMSYLVDNIPYAYVIETDQSHSEEWGQILTFDKVQNDYISYIRYMGAMPWYDVIYYNDGTITTVFPSAHKINLNITENGTIYNGQYFYEEINVNVPTGGGSLTVKTATLTKTSTSKTISFSSLSGEPKYWYLRITSQLSSSGTTTYYYIANLFYDGTNIKGNSFRIGSTRRIYDITSGISQSYSNGTLTITGGSSTGATPGQFYGTSNFGYELVYIY